MNMSTGKGVPPPLCQGFLKKRKDKMVQSVREVNRSENNRYLFEITMKNGKKKMLAADTADVRQEWMDQLWKAMLLNGPDRTGSVSNGELEPDNNLETQSSWCEESNTETGSSSTDSRCLSIGQESFQSFSESHSSSESPESGGLLNDMIACLDSESAAWVKTAPL
ncbi:hypothetical protein DPX16_11106 [Anabarilius grahami]|uniref:PH domain-containing protein n=1 Tax=Anabarilius grahami TaxID=495550 RepID=A0A3N0Y276_ANAGA|nr:hypothetical protein DPX16_11106 [Anabarilius grahami]